MEDFLQWSRGEAKLPFALATAKTRAMIDYTAYQTAQGVKIYSAVPPNVGTDFFCGELLSMRR